VYSNGKNGFFIITIFNDDTPAPSGVPGVPAISASSITGYMNRNDGSIVFSPNGSLFDGGKCVFKNPLTAIDTFSTSWPALSTSTFSSWNNDNKIPNFFLSYQGRWILCNDTAKSGNWYLLSNPINTPSFVWDNNTFGDYCSFIEYQDPGCYCANYSNQPKKCSYAFFPSENDAIPFVDSPQTTAQNIQAQQTLNNNCGCNTTCQNYLKGAKTGAPSQNQSVTCNAMVSSVFCNAGPIAYNKGEVIVPGLAISQSCGNSGTDVTPTTPNTPTPNTPTPNTPNTPTPNTPTPNTPNTPTTNTPTATPTSPVDQKTSSKSKLPIIIGGIILIIFIILIVVINV
jgi:hypothetical protein